MVPDFSDIALIVVDLQERLCPAMPQDVVADVIRNADILAELVLEYGGKVYYTEQYPKGLGPTVEVLRERLKDSVRVEKVAFSCLGEPRFVDEVLPELPADIIVVGMETHVCVLQTVFDLVTEDLSESAERTVYLPVDAVCSRKKLHWENALDQMVEVGVVLTSTETLVFQALKEAGGERFKHFSKRIR